MKKIILVLFALSLPLIFSSCSDNSVTAPDYTDYTQWSLIDSNSTGYISKVVLADENTLYGIKDNLPCKIQNGNITTLDLQDADFIPDDVYVLTGSYFIYRGHSSTDYTLRLKIVKDNVVTVPTSMPALGEFKDLFIIEKNKFALGIDSNIYVYRNDSFTKIVLRSGSNSNEINVVKFFYRDLNLYVLAQQGYYPIKSYIYKVGSNNVEAVTYNGNDGGGFLLGPFYAKFISGFNNLNLSFFTQYGWHTIFTAPVRNYMHVIGENLDYIYMIAQETDSMYSPWKAIVWNGTKLIEETDQPTLSTGFITAIYSNMRSGTFYFIGAKSGRNYIYKGKRILSN